MLGLSELAPRVFQSEIRAMSVLCDAAGGVNLAQGICDTAVPAIVAEGAAKAIRDGNNIYTRLEGISRLRRAVAGHVEQFGGRTVDPEREVLITSGATGAFHAATLALLNPGDEVIVFEPFYGYHLSTLRAIRAVPVVVALEMPGWRLDLEAVRAAVTEKTRAMVINTPANPSGKVFSRAELEGLAEIAREHDLFVITDEMYEHFVYGGVRHVSAAAIEKMAERTVVISGFSKTFSVTGWRVGFLLADPKWVASIGYFHDLLYVCAPAPLQHGVADGLERLERAFYEGLGREYETKRDLLLGALREAGLKPHVPEGAYYVLADAARIPGETGAEKARCLLKKTGVAAVAGSAFFRSTPGERGRGEDLLRFCFAKKDEDLLEACRRLREARFQ